MKTATFDDLRSWGPCWEPYRVDAIEAQYEPEPWTALDILDESTLPDVSAEDRLWVVLRPELLTKRTLRLFACDCAERACERAGWDDPRSLAAIAVARRHAEGQATDEELVAARAAAWDAARDAAGAAAWAAAWAARDAARDAAWAAAWAAARDAARDAAGAAEREWQLGRLRELIALHEVSDVR